jgi:hypothetical protein
VAVAVVERFNVPPMQTGELELIAGAAGVAVTEIVTLAGVDVQAVVVLVTVTE